MRNINIIVLLLALSSCAQENHVNSNQEIRYNQENIFNLNISEYQIVNSDLDKTSSLAHLMPHSFNALIKIWANDNIRVKNKNSENILKIVIKENNVQEEVRKKWVVYKTNLKVAFEIYNKNDLLMPKQDINIDLMNSREVSKKSSSEEHQFALYLMQKEIMDEFNSKIREAINNSFTKLLILQ